MEKQRKDGGRKSRARMSGQMDGGEERRQNRSEEIDSIRIGVGGCVVGEWTVSEVSWWANG